MLQNWMILQRHYHTSCHTLFIEASCEGMMADNLAPHPSPCRGDVTLECAGPEPVTISHVTFDGGKHTVKAPEEAPLPAGAVPAFA